MLLPARRLSTQPTGYLTINTKVTLLYLLALLPLPRLVPAQARQKAAKMTKAVAKQPVDYVKVFTGTSNSRWALFPGPTMPFGLVKLSPDNQGQVWTAGYEYTVSSISGFSHLHAFGLSGLSVMPAIWKILTRPKPTLVQWTDPSARCGPPATARASTSAPSTPRPATTAWI